MTPDIAVYEAWRSFAASWGLGFFTILFFVALFWTLRPSRRAEFDEAAQIPLRED
jgi:cytochrome c oxidase cbb3-type subunit IV